MSNGTVVPTDQGDLRCPTEHGCTNRSGRSAFSTGTPLYQQIRAICVLHRYTAVPTDQGDLRSPPVHGCSTVFSFQARVANTRPDGLSSADGLVSCCSRPWWSSRFYFWPAGRFDESSNPCVMKLLFMPPLDTRCRRRTERYQ